MAASLNREAIYVALAALLAAIPGVVVCDRRFRSVSEVQPNDQPAIFLQEDGETPESKRGLPTIWTLHAAVFVYFRTDGELGVAPGTTANGLLTAIENAVNWINGDPAAMSQNAPTTLRGLLISCGFAGKTEIGLGDTTGQGGALLHLNLRATAGG